MPHFVERKLKPKDPHDLTRVMWSRGVPDQAIVFVHGYRGEAIATWTRFETMLTRRPEADPYALFFYGYDCLRGDTWTAGSMLCDFLHQLATSPGDVLKG